MFWHENKRKRKYIYLSKKRIGSTILVEDWDNWEVAISCPVDQMHLSRKSVVIIKCQRERERERERSYCTPLIRCSEGVCQCACIKVKFFPFATKTPTCPSNLICMGKGAHAFEQESLPKHRPIYWTFPTPACSFFRKMSLMLRFFYQPISVIDFICKYPLCQFTKSKERIFLWLKKKCKISMLIKDN
jgi:hypothetical protein